VSNEKEGGFRVVSIDRYWNGTSVLGSIFSLDSAVLIFLWIQSGNGNMQIKIGQLITEKKECPALKCPSIIYRLIPFSTPYSSGLTLPFRLTPGS